MIILFLVFHTILVMKVTFSDLFSKLINNCKIAHEALEAIDTITVTADPLSPMKHIRLIENNSEEALREICNLVSSFGNVIVRFSHCNMAV